MRVVALSMLVFVATVSAAVGQDNTPPAEPSYLRDRGTGVSTSMFATYVRKHELIVYPFYEYYRDRNFEYKPEEFGAAGDTDFRGRFRVHEALAFVAYGLTENLAVEFEAATISATLRKAPADTSLLAREIKESGLGDVEGQVRWRWRTENEHRPEWFSYAEFVVPHAADKPLIGTPGMEMSFGTAVTRGFRWGTVTARGAVEYSRASSSPWDIGEYGVEYLKRLSPKWRVYIGVEGTQDQLSVITEAQWHFLPNAFVRLNNGRGVTSKATDWSPELGIVFTVPASR